MSVSFTPAWSKAFIHVESIISVWESVYCRRKEYPSCIKFLALQTRNTHWQLSGKTERRSDRKLNSPSWVSDKICENSDLWLTELWPKATRQAWQFVTGCVDGTKHLFLTYGWRVVSLESYPTVLAPKRLSAFRIKHLLQLYDNDIAYSDLNHNVEQNQLGRTVWRNGSVSWVPGVLCVVHISRDCLDLQWLFVLAYNVYYL